MYYQTQDSLEEFLGTSMPPEELTPETLTSLAAGTLITRLDSYISRYPRGLAPKGAFLGEHGKGASRRLAAEAEWSLPRGTLNKIFECLERPCTCVLADILPGGSAQELWAILVGYVFLRPFGLTAPFSVY